MGPRLPVSHRPHSCLAQAVVLRNDALWSAICSNGSDLIIGQLGAVMLGAKEAWRRSVAALRDAVALIVQHRAEKQMLRIHTRRVVAPMANHQTIWNDTTICQFPRHAICDYWPSESRMLNLSITSSGERSLPRPALIFSQLVNLRPKANFQRRNLMWHSPHFIRGNS